MMSVKPFKHITLLIGNPSVMGVEILCWCSNLRRTQNLYFQRRNGILAVYRTSIHCCY